jgi:sugar O-acyltransferase (sialic acid O-acetyltransferase NeuD family)
MENIVLVGSSGHTKVVIDVVEKEGRYRIAGLIDDFRSVGEKTLGYSIIGAQPDLPALLSQYSLAGIIVAIGDNALRAELSERAGALCPGLPFAVAVHPGACIAKASTVGPGSVVMAGCVLGPCSAIGRSCILNTKASLDHDSVMEDYSSLAPGVTTGGNCRICRCAAVGIGAIVRHGITVGQHSVVGAGATVLRDVEPFSVAYGTPARKIREREKGEKYL